MLLGTATNIRMSLGLAYHFLWRLLEEIHWSSLRLGKFSSLSGAEALTDFSVATVKIVLTGVLQLQSIIKRLVVLSASGADFMLVPKRE